MMYWYSDHMTGWSYALMAIGTLIFWALIIGGVVVLVRYLGREAHATPASPPAPAPEQILAERFARGEIDPDQYDERVEHLRTAGRAMARP